MKLFACSLACWLSCTAGFKRFQTPYLNSWDLKLSINSVELSNWGVFPSLKVEFESSPRYTCLTGETGSGKSVLISALQYICGKSKQAKFNSNGYVQLNAQTDNGESLWIKRSYNIETKKSTCEVNGRKLLVKDIQSYLGENIRFWSPDDIRKLESDNFISYIDQNVGGESLTLLAELEAEHTRWISAYAKLAHLCEIEGKLNSGSDEHEIIRRNMAEIQVMESSLRDIFQEIKDTILSGEEVLSEGTVIHENNPTGELQSLILHSLGADKSHLDLSTATWDAVLAGEVYLKKLGKSLEILVPKNPPSGPSARAFSGYGGDKVKKGIQMFESSDLRALEDRLSDFSAGMLTLQSQLTKLGWSRSNSHAELEAVHVAVQEATANIRSIQASVAAIVDDLPDTTGLLMRLSAVKSELERLAKKHNTNPADLEATRAVFRENLEEISNLSELLPRFADAERQSRIAYIALATKLSRLRYQSASELTRKVNRLLPSLDISNKVVRVRQRSLVDIAGQHKVDASGETSTAASSGSGGEVLTPMSPHVRPDGWDQMCLIIGSVMPSPASTLTLSVENGEYVVFEEIGMSRGGQVSWRGDEAESDIVDVNWDGAMSSARSVFSVLSSGEQARLALALEATSFSAAAASEQSLLVLDEIDAHVGGEAAVAIARLLKDLGRKQHIIAVTHNPLIAAAADVHLVVQRDKPTPMSGSSKFQQTSFITRRNGNSERADELARMTTGNLGTDAGRDLANALLEIDFSSI